MQLATHQLAELRNQLTRTPAVELFSNPRFRRIVSNWIAATGTLVPVETDSGGGGTGVQTEAIEYQRSSSGAVNSFPALRFPGQYYDAETELHENWNRSYDPSTGRYLQPEPLLFFADFQESEAMAGYQAPAFPYARNSPTRFSDPTGYCPWCIVIGIGIGGKALFDALAVTAFVGTAAVVGHEIAVGMSGAKPEGLIQHVDEHIQKLDEADNNCASGMPPDPEDPRKDARDSWRTELNTAIKNLKQILKKMPINRIKRSPVEDAIARAEARLGRPSPAAPPLP